MVATDLHWGSVFLSWRWSGKSPAEIREQKAMAEALPGGGFRLRPAPEAGSGNAAPLGPAPQLPAQRADCLPAPDVLLRAAAHRGFSALFNGRSVPFPSGRSRCAVSARARSRAAGNLRGAGPRRALGVPDTSGLRHPLAMAKGSRTPSARGLCGGWSRESGDLKTAENNSPGKT